MSSLKEARNRAGLSQMNLCARAGVDQRMVSLIENGRQPMSRAFAAKVAGPLGVSADELFAGQNAERVVKAAAAVVETIREGEGEYPAELGRVIKQLAELAATDRGQLGRVAARCVVAVRKAVVEQAPKKARDFGERDGVGRRCDSAEHQRDGLGRRRDDIFKSGR